MVRCSRHEKNVTGTKRTGRPQAALHIIGKEEKMSGGRIIRAPFIDPITGVAYDTNNSEFEGYLTKQSLWLRVSLYVTVASVVSFLVSTAPAIVVYYAVGFSFFCMY